MTTYYAAQLGVALSVVDCKASYLDSLKNKQRALDTETREGGSEGQHQVLDTILAATTTTLPEDTTITSRDSVKIRNLQPTSSKEGLTS